MTSAMLPNLSLRLAQGADRAAPTGAFEVYRAANYAHRSPAEREQKAKCPITKMSFYEGQLVWRADASEGGDNRHYDPEAFLAWARKYGMDPYTKAPIPPAAMQALEERVDKLRAAKAQADKDGIYSVWVRDDAELLTQRLLLFEGERGFFPMRPGWFPHTEKAKLADKLQAAARAERARELRNTIDRLPEEGRDDAPPPADPAAAAEHWQARDAGVEPMQFFY